MANITYTKWLERCEGIYNLRTEITEIEVTNNYTPTGNEFKSWDASNDGDGSAMVYVVGAKLFLVCDSLTAINDDVFNHFISVEKISGLGSVTTIGESAFRCTPKLAEVDIVWSNLTMIGADAFRLSGIEDHYDLSALPSNIIVGDRATRIKRWWSKDALEKIKKVGFPSERIYFDVPNTDSQKKYDATPYITIGKEVRSVKQQGCRSLTNYHIWNAIYAGTSKEYPDFLTWFDEKLNADGKFAEINRPSVSEAKEYECLGWTAEDPGTEKISSTDQLEYILSSLTNGHPVSVSMVSSVEKKDGQEIVYYHAVAVIGCDPSTKKLAFLDSDVRTDKGVVYWAAYEDVFVEGETEDSEVIRKVDYNLPMLAPGDKWFTPGETAVTKTEITEIEVVTSYTPTGNEPYWDASAKKDGSVTAYVDGTKLIIAGNGDICVFANPDSSYAFSNSGNNFSKIFTGMKKFSGSDLLNTRMVRSFWGMFFFCRSLAEIDVSSWDTSSGTNMRAMFSILPELKSLDVSNWDVSNVTNMGLMFQGNQSYGLSGLRSVGDLSRWNTKSVTNMMAMFNCCPNLEYVNIGNWDVANVTDFRQMFRYCHALKELDFSNWDTSHAQQMSLMMQYADKLEKVTVGEKFSFCDAVLPTPSADYILLADGNWYDYDYNAYAPADVPSNVSRTYYASKFVAAGDDAEVVFVKNGTLRKIAVALRHKSGKSDAMLPAEFAEEILALTQ